MLPKTGLFKFHLESYACDFTGKATLPVIGNFILQAATIHAQERGFGYEEVSKDNVAWVLSRLAIETSEYLGHGRDITVETWVEAVAAFFTQRCFRFLDEENKVVGYARTVWAAINMETRRPVDIPHWCPGLVEYVEEGKECPIEKTPKIPAVKEGAEPATSYFVRYSDIDINKHMNSVKYIEHVINVFDLAFFKEKQIHRFDMAYLAEGAFGDKLDLYMQKNTESEYLIDTKKGTDSVCRSRITWKDL